MSYSRLWDTSQSMDCANTQSGTNWFYFNNTIWRVLLLYIITAFGILVLLWFCKLFAAVSCEVFTHIPQGHWLALGHHMIAPVCERTFHDVGNQTKPTCSMERAQNHGRWCSYPRLLTAVYSCLSLAVNPHLRQSAGRPGPSLNIKIVFSRYGIPMLKIRRSRDRLIFNMGIHILIRPHLYIETAPCQTFILRTFCLNFENNLFTIIFLMINLIGDIPIHYLFMLRVEIIM